MWTEERKKTVVELWQAGQSAAQISRAIGPPFVTRNAIIGVVHREGIRRGGSPKAAYSRKPRDPLEIKRTHSPFGAKKIGMPQPPTLPSSAVTPNKVKLPEPASLKVAHADLKGRHCRWPSEEAPFTFCGARHEKGSAYCEHHDKRAYNEPTPKEKRRVA